MSYAITSPFPSFNDTDGSPLNNGYVYVGQPNLNPVTDPTPVYWDEALTQPAAQPVRTINGYFSRNGSPGRLYTGLVSYSIRITNNKGALVFSDLNYLDPSSTAGNNYQQVITAISGQTVFSLNRTYVPGTNDLFVYRNGLRLIVGQDYTESSYNEITLTAGADNGDEFVFDIGYSYDSGITVDASGVQYKYPDASSVFTNVEAKLSETVSVRDFGAVGDGVTDDTAAIQAAIDAVDLTGGGAVYVPNGIYIISNSFNVPSNVLIYGDGDASIIRCASTMLAPTYNPTNIAAGFRVFLLYNVSNIRITNLRIDSSLVYQPQGSTPSTWRARDVYAYGVSDVSVDNCSFLSSGAATVFTNSSKYRVVNNDIVCQSVNGIPNHDGIIDQWWGSHDFVISGNRIDGQVTMGYYAILLTATNTDGSAGTPMYNAVISDNVVQNCKVGIWVMGRSGRCYSVSVADNILSNISTFNGISVSNSDGISVVGNTTYNTFRSGVAVFSEAGFTSGCTGVVVSGNTISNAGTGNTTGPNIERSGIAVSSTAMNSSNSVVGNTIIGTTHTYCVFLGTDGVENIGGAYTIGSAGLYQNLGVGSVARFGGGNTPDALYWTRNSESNRLTTIQNAISATSNAVTLKFDNGAIDFKNAGSANMFRVTNIPAAVNGVQVYPQTAGVGPVLTAIGSDTNIDLRLAGQGTGAVAPNSDNLINLGKATLRWATVYAGTGTINTSDEREKQDIETLNQAEKNVASALKGLVKKFRFKDAVQAKGDAARIHVGVIAQEVIAAFADEGLDATRYGILCFDEWEEQEAVLDENGNAICPHIPAGNRYGVRYEELLAFIISAI